MDRNAHSETVYITPHMLISIYLAKKYVKIVNKRYSISRSFKGRKRWKKNSASKLTNKKSKNGWSERSGAVKRIAQNL